ncbi:hypothetical protein E6Q11_00135 [Candidatus Dojkabacteria bacterium]|uniref:Uncharacterized protein n=1 Tax=Candidatus Dojkabacteria bacterium TaxID=2099670 RepID=A0A5C7JBR5_9BACT|nr:MAG: hypothetical protein E6Q11_00135 [Candidatus Dojkabacteria bacterium]
MVATSSTSNGNGAHRCIQMEHQEVVHQRKKVGLTIITLSGYKGAEDLHLIKALLASAGIDSIANPVNGTLTISSDATDRVRNIITTMNSW